jgi:hypothetical protein
MAPYTIYGNELSPYSIKVRSYFRSPILERFEKLVPEPSIHPARPTFDAIDVGNDSIRERAPQAARRRHRVLGGRSVNTVPPEEPESRHRSRANRRTPSPVSDSLRPNRLAS